MTRALLCLGWLSILIQPLCLAVASADPLIPQLSDSIGVQGPATSACCEYSSPGNPFPCNNGNCTWWCYYKRPEVYPACSGHAEQWLIEAEEGGLPE